MEMEIHTIKWGDKWIMPLNAINFDNIVCGSNIEIKLRDAFVVKISGKKRRRRNDQTIDG